MESVHVVCIPYALLADEDADLLPLIEQAYGPDGLGLITISGVPQYIELRESLLPLAARFASLPAGVLSQYEDPESTYSVGWSHGQEAMRPGCRDLLKGSFYANPTVDLPQLAVPEAAERFPSYCRPNLWPRAHLPQLEGAFKALGALMVAVGLKLAAHCDRYIASRCGHGGGAMADVLRRSQCHKGRLLHYFPPASAGMALQAGHEQHGTLEGGGTHPSGEGAAVALDTDDWCGWHRDHGALTALTSAMYMRGGEPVDCPDPSSGLYIQASTTKVVKATIPPTHLAFQVRRIGQALAIHSHGLFRATPHCVRGCAPSSATAGISRNTFAVFMQPDVAEPLGAPLEAASSLPIPSGPLNLRPTHSKPGLSSTGAAAVGSRRWELKGAAQGSDVRVLAADQGVWREGMSFGEFAELTMKAYYQQPASEPLRAGASVSMYVMHE